mmetsp:Transcript_26155/g.44104  ORF Transcript_26155/g.44104 Transcript_26155/m.44104 type:complete len:267 (+) Transcript_26155:2064-2864(+)
MILQSFCDPVGTGGGVIKHLFVAENPICQVSSFILKSYVATIPQIESINGSTISTSDRDMSAKVFGRILSYANLPRRDDPLAWCDPRASIGWHSQHQSSLDNRPSELCFQENAWTSNLFDRSEINYHHYLLENNRDALPVSLKKPVDTPPPPQATLSTPFGGSDGNILVNRRGNLEYKYPYKSTFHHSNPPRVSAVAPLLPSQQSHLNSISSMMQLVLQRRNVEEKFSKLFLRTIDYALLDAVKGLQLGELPLGEGNATFAGWSNS